MPIQDERIWLCNLTPKDIEMNIKLRLDMAKQVLISWATITYSEDMDASQYQFTPLWANSLIKRAGAPIFDYKFIQSNISTLADIHDLTAKNFITSEKIKENTGEIIDTMTLSVERHAMPRAWRPIINSLTIQEIEDSTSKVDQTLSLKSPSKQMYWKIIETQSQKSDQTRLLWAVELETKIDPEQWSQLYQFIMTITVSTRLRYFQCKLLNRAITTNVIRHKWSKDTSPTCAFCNNAPETVLHVLYECIISNKLWAVVGKWTKYHYKIEIPTDPPSIILNNASTPHRRLVNMIILVMKYHIYVAKCKEEKPTFHGFLERLNYWYNIEKTMAFQNNKVPQFNKKWKMYAV